MMYNSKVMVSGNMTVPGEVQEQMQALHEHLMLSGFPYNSVTVIYRPNDLGLHCFFSKKVEDKITDEIKDAIKHCKATYSVNKQ